MNIYILPSSKKSLKNKRKCKNATNILLNPIYLFEYLLQIESNTPEINPLQDDVENAIESLRSILNDNYLAPEKLMSLRNPETKSLNESVAKIEDLYNELMKLMSSNMIPAQTIADVATNKREFDARISDWFTCTGTMGSNKDITHFNAAPTCSTKSTVVEAHGLLLSRLGNFKQLFTLNRRNNKLTMRESGRKNSSVSQD